MMNEQPAATEHCPICHKDLSSSIRLLGADAYTWHLEVHQRNDALNALEAIVALHGSKEHPRHEATAMANIARAVLDEYKRYSR